jgi:hypothetical protein
LFNHQCHLVLNHCHYMILNSVSGIVGEDHAARLVPVNISAHQYLALSPG